MSIDKSFLGRGWSFPPEFNRNVKDVKMVSEEEDIQQSLHILLSTSPGERIMQPTYGCDLHSIVFDNISESTITEIKDIVQRAILFFEPRIILNSVDIDTSQQFDGLLTIVLDYIIRTTNSRNNMVYPFYFLEGSHITF